VPTEYRLSKRSESAPPPLTPQCGVVPTEYRLSERSESAP